MNAYEIIESANYDLDHNKITLGEWEKRIEPTKNVKPIVDEEWKDLINEIDKLPRIKVGNSNSPTVKYCIDENLIYDLLERYKGEAVGEMTKEEAIEIIKGRNFNCIECIDRSEECCEALNMAIKALEFMHEDWEEYEEYCKKKESEEEE